MFPFLSTLCETSPSRNSVGHGITKTLKGLFEDFCDDLHATVFFPLFIFVELHVEQSVPTAAAPQNVSVPTTLRCFSVLCVGGFESGV